MHETLWMRRDLLDEEHDMLFPLQRDRVTNAWGSAVEYAVQNIEPSPGLDLPVFTGYVNVQHCIDKHDVYDFRHSFQGYPSELGFQLLETIDYHKAMLHANYSERVLNQTLRPMMRQACLLCGSMESCTQMQLREDEPFTMQ